MKRLIIFIVLSTLAGIACQAQTVEQADSLHQRGRELVSKGRIAEGRECTRQAMEIRKRLLGEVSEDYITSLNNYALTYSLEENYAEALNEAYGPEEEDPNGMLRSLSEEEEEGGICTAKDAINAIRTRVGMPELRPEQYASQAAMRETIHHERQIELCFEGHRFYDVRRWKEGEKFGQPIHGIKITPTGFGSDSRPTGYTYEVVKVEDRVWEDKMYWWPIPYSEVVKYKKSGSFTQNPGWE